MGTPKKISNLVQLSRPVRGCAPLTPRRVCSCTCSSLQKDDDDFYDAKLTNTQHSLALSSSLARAAARIRLGFWFRV
jgi:hypothetical protein